LALYAHVHQSLVHSESHSKHMLEVPRVYVALLVERKVRWFCCCITPSLYGHSELGKCREEQHFTETNI